MNPLAGDTLLKLGNQEFILRPDFAATTRIEGRCDIGLLTFVIRNRKDTRVSDIVIAFAALAVSGGHKDFTEEDAYRLVKEHGVLEVCIGIVKCIRSVLDRSSAAAAEKKTEIPPPVSPPEETGT